MFSECPILAAVVAPTVLVAILVFFAELRFRKPEFRAAVRALLTGWLDGVTGRADSWLHHAAPTAARGHEPTP